MSCAPCSTIVIETTSSIARATRLARGLGAALLLAPASSLKAQASQPESPLEKGGLVTDVRLRGVSHVDLHQLAAGLATKPSKCRTLLLTPFCLLTKSPTFYERRTLDPLEMRRDALRIRLFYWRRGYRDATVVTKTEHARGGTRVIFAVNEGKPTVVQTLDVQQTENILPKRAITAALHVHAGDPLDLVAMDSTIGTLRDALWERGYADAEVELDTTRISEALKAGPVSIVVRPGHLTKVRTIDIEGNHKVSDRTVRRLLSFRAGGLYRRSDVLGSQRNLWLSGLFSEVNMETPPTDDGQKVVQLKVTEANLNQLEMSTGFTTADFFQVQTQFTRYNLLGSARRVTVQTTVSNLGAGQLNGSGIFHDVTSGARDSLRDAFLHPTWSASIEFAQPWFLSSHTQLGASLFSHRRSVPGIAIDRGSGASFAVTHEFNLRTSSTLGYTYTAASIEASEAYFCVSFGVCVPSTIRVIAKRNLLAPVSSTTQFDLTNDPFAPDRGYKARIDLEYASQATQSDFRYGRVAASASSYHRLGRQSVLAGRVRLGWVAASNSTNAALGVSALDSTRIIHPSKRFYAGGSQSVRGYGENQLGPRVLTISPATLTDTNRAGHCTVAELQNLSCDPNRVKVGATGFQAQPVGGTTLAEGSIEYRFPLRFVGGLTGALFVDGAIVSTGQFADMLRRTGSVTPGFGVRLDTPVGPVRLDVGIRPSLVETLPVITEVTDASGISRLVTLKTPRRYDPLDTSGNAIQKLLTRLMLHLAIGPAF
jgi:outer membrane protein assembly factor BamA